LYESLIFLSWFISAIHLIIEQRTKSRLLGSITTPILFFLSGFSSLTLPVEMQKALPLVPSLQSNWLMMHVSMMMISYATLIIGSLFSLFYLAIFYFKSKEILQVVNLPSSSSLGVETDFESTMAITKSSFSIDRPMDTLTQTLPVSNQESSSIFSLLQTIDIWSYRIIGLGFPFLTIGIISGAVWANEAWGAYWSWDPKETWALITWLVFAVYLHSRLLKGWQGEKAAIVGSFGFFVIWICYLGVNFLGKGLHSYGWVLN
jgi:cytochrome c-type biogenesis protein CcsB